jgi:hypothetical protein
VPVKDVQADEIWSLIGKKESIDLLGGFTPKKPTSTCSVHRGSEYGMQGR